ncbi:uncharacterized protein FMAN_03307 [Fusarium mangiferae]|uniref:Uncharacterized protein n=1 Tax=Fusarium mangiferae TaxID=192010 RepID=A0A1L7TFL2_FUSMA|nr:uncharacterized protein FMAN_03307 [Fusarium mangiferae]CVK94041.1 uncharacterized protein FMAN_03307 [Fusarium mangiferae]
MQAIAFLIGVDPCLVWIKAVTEADLLEPSERDISLRQPNTPKVRL